MPRKKAFDAKKMIKMVKEETPQAEIMKAFGFKTSAQLKAAYYRALVEAGEIPAIVGGRGGVRKPVEKNVGVGKRGSIIIPKDLVDKLGIKAGEKFALRRSKSGLALKRVAG
jgi:AbrB family looped-hinge helix DNA binding protein